MRRKPSLIVILIAVGGTYFLWWTLGPLFRPASKPPEPAPAMRPLPELTPGGPNGVDFSLRLGDLGIVSEYTYFTARALRGGEPAGFGVYIDRGGVRIASRGDESDRFLAALAEAYGVPAGRAVMWGNARFRMTVLSGDPARIRDEPLEMRLVFELLDRPERYAEFTMKVDVKEALVQFEEVDYRYRGPIIAALLGQK